MGDLINCDNGERGLYDQNTIDKRFCIDATNVSGMMVNDSIQLANAVMKVVHIETHSHLCLFSLKDIRKGGEIVCFDKLTEQNIYWRYQNNQEETLPVYFSGPP